MSAAPGTQAEQSSKAGSTLIYSAAGLLLLGAMALDTTVVPFGSDLDAINEQFSPKAFGEAQFPGIQDYVLKQAQDATAMAPEILEDKKKAGLQYGIKAGVGYSIPVRFSGLVGESKAGNYTIEVAGMPEAIRLRLQTGPAINGSDLRDVTGNIEFGQFKNQIEYQNAGAAINSALKTSVLADIDTKNLSGKQISVHGVFKLINPKNWLVTPVAIEVQ